jgi:hypothetical protein
VLVANPLATLDIKEQILVQVLDSAQAAALFVRRKNLPLIEAATEQHSPSHAASTD